MSRAFRPQIDAGIVDVAARLFAQRGPAKTSVQDVADAVGLSKSGLLRHFPSKDALGAAVTDEAHVIGSTLLGLVDHLPLGIERDRRAVEHVVDLALAHPGLTALLLAEATRSDDAGGGGLPVHVPGRSFVLDAFAVDLDSGDTDRIIRVIHAMAGLAIVAIAAADLKQTTAWRPHVVATCLDALGHSRPTATVPSSAPTPRDR